MTGLRGARSQIQGRFESVARDPFDDGWAADDGDAPAAPATTVTDERARSIIARNASPDVPFEQSINPYRGCEHGCVYCPPDMMFHQHFNISNFPSRYLALQIKAREEGLIA
mgnify:CR=1 FL=1